jgi:hypothetical protein
MPGEESGKYASLTDIQKRFHDADLRPRRLEGSGLRDQREGAASGNADRIARYLGPAHAGQRRPVMARVVDETENLGSPQLPLSWPELTRICLDSLRTRQVTVCPRRAKLNPKGPQQQTTSVVAG